MADIGWVFSPTEDRWELRDELGDVLGVVSQAFIDRVGVLQSTRLYLRRGWPPPPADRDDAPVWCVMASGLFEGRHLYLRQRPVCLTFDEQGQPHEATSPVDTSKHAAVYLAEGFDDRGRQVYRPLRVPA